MNVETDADVDKADALLPLLAAVTENEREQVVRTELAGALDVTNPGWRDNPAFIERIKEVGVVDAAKGLLKTHDLWPRS